MLKLTDSELDIIFATACSLAVQDRDPFHVTLLSGWQHCRISVTASCIACAQKVQRRHWEPPVGIEVGGPLPRKYGTL